MDKEQEEQFDQWSEEQIKEWERSRAAEKAEGGKGRRLTKKKRQTKEQGGRMKRLKHEVLTNWGEEEQTQGATDEGGADQPLVVENDERGLPSPAGGHIQQPESDLMGGPATSEDPLTGVTTQPKPWWRSQGKEDYLVTSAGKGGVRQEEEEKESGDSATW